MKKLYLLTLACAFLSLTNHADAQYTATRNGNWSNPITWAPGAPPSATCVDCAVTINSNITVTLDAHVVLNGNSVLTVKSGGKLIIPNSNSATTDLATGYNIILDTIPGNSSIKLESSTSIVDATNAGPVDGIFSGVFGGTIALKVVGNAPSLFIGTFVASSAPPKYTSVSGPSTLSSGGTLPVVLTDFDAAYQDGSVLLSWNTQVERNSDHFNVLRSPDGKSWEIVGKVQAHGTSNVVLHYSFTDAKPSGSVNYYRLESVDIDGKTQLSEVKVVRSSSVAGINIFPNPATSFVNVSFGADATSDVTLRFFNQAGQLIHERKLSRPAGTTYTIPVTQAASGNYLLQVTSADGTTKTRNVVIAHQ